MRQYILASKTCMLKLKLLAKDKRLIYTVISNFNSLEEKMKHVKTISNCSMKKNGGCGECQSSCQSACKTSCTVGNQTCVQKDEKILKPEKKND